MYRRNSFLSLPILSFPFLSLLTLGSAGCDDVDHGRAESLADHKGAGLIGSEGAAAVPRPGTVDLAAVDASEDEYVIVGVDDVDRHGWQYGFGVGERVPRATLEAQRDRVRRIDALYKEWLQSEQDPQEFWLS